MSVSIEEYLQIEKRIDTAEDRVTDSVRDSLRERWEFGRLMLAERTGKQLPKGRIAELAQVTGKSQTELSYRAQFAEQYPTEDEVSTALETFTSWTQVKTSLPKTVRRQTPPTRRKREEAIRKELEAEFESRIQALEQEIKRIEGSARRVLAARNGILSRSDYDLIRSCLHPDSRLSVTDQKLANAFRVFNEAEIVLLNENDCPTTLPATADVLKRRRPG